MAYYWGETLKKTLMRGPLTVEKALDIGSQIARGLATVHSHGIVHRDIKPANVMITKDGLAKIVDFGLAQLTDVTRITGTGATIGRPRTCLPSKPSESRWITVPISGRSESCSTRCSLARFRSRAAILAAVIHSILSDRPRPLTEHHDELPAELGQIVEKALEKDPKYRYRDAETSRSSTGYAKSSTPGSPESGRNSYPSHTDGRPSGWWAESPSPFFLGGLVYWSVERDQETEAFLAEIGPALEANDLDRVFFEPQSGFDLNNSRLDALAEKIAGELTITTEPPGASASITRVHPIESFSEREGLALGTTPIPTKRLVAGEYLLGLRRNGSAVDLVLSIRPGDTIELSRRLLIAEDLGDMVLVEAGTSRVLGDDQPVPAFLIDRHEVTNRMFAAFVAAGGYRNPEFWPPSLVVNGESKPWEFAVGTLVDGTGIPGPRKWSGGTIPESKADHPVVGVSWYEAAAYAKWAGKELPSREQWWRAALGTRGEVFPWGDDVRTLEARANFDLSGTDPIGSYPLGVSPYGCYDMAGNVREWLREEAGGVRRVVGGSWLDPSYMFEPTHIESFAPDYANEAIGFRCVKTISSSEGES